MPNSESKLDQWLIQVGQWCSWIYGLAALFTVFEVIMRYIFQSPTLWVHESVTYLGAFCLVLGNNYCMSKKTHIKVDLLYAYASKTFQKVLDIFNTSICIILFVSLTYASYDLFYRSWFTPLGEFRLQTTGSPWDPPFPAFLKLILFLCMTLALLQSILRLFHLLKSK